MIAHENKDIEKVTNRFAKKVYAIGENKRDTTQSYTAMTLTNPNYPRLTFIAILILAIVTCWYTFHCRNTNGPNYKVQHERLIKQQNKDELDSLQKIAYRLTPAQRDSAYNAQRATK